MPLALSGVSTFYTAEYYELCLKHLKPGGMVSQWVPLHSLNPEVVRSLIATFTSVFPHYTAWFINADVFLIGSNEPLKLDAARIQSRLANPRLDEALKAVGFMDVESVLGCYLMDEVGLNAYAEGGTVMRDDLPWAEFVAPKLVYERTQHESMAELEKHMSSPLPLFTPGADSEFLARVERRHLAHVNDMKAVQEYYSGMAIGNKALDSFLASLAIDPTDWNAKFYVGEIARLQAEVFFDWEEHDKALEMLAKVLPHLPDDAELLALRDAHVKAQAEKAGTGPS
jgi:tetratricopeptide (TPR) repeat protein